MSLLNTAPTTAKRLAVCLALLALWLQALLPAVHHPVGMAGQAGSAIAHNLCLAPGTPPTGPVDKEPTHKPLPCPICQTSQILAAGFAPPDAIVLPLPRDAGAILDATTAPFALTTSPKFPFRARGPPLSA